MSEGSRETKVCRVCSCVDQDAQSCHAISDGSWWRRNLVAGKVVAEIEGETGTELDSNER